MLRYEGQNSRWQMIKMKRIGRFLKGLVIVIVGASVWITVGILLMSSTSYGLPLRPLYIFLWISFSVVISGLLVYWGRIHIKNWIARKKRGRGTYRRQIAGR